MPPRFREFGMTMSLLHTVLNLLAVWALRLKLKEATLSCGKFFKSVSSQEEQTEHWELLGGVQGEQVGVKCSNLFIIWLLVFLGFLAVLFLIGLLRFSSFSFISSLSPCMRTKTCNLLQRRGCPTLSAQTFSKFPDENLSPQLHNNSLSTQAPSI